MNKLDTSKIKADFNVLNNNPDLVYLDSAASSLKPISVVNKLVEYYNEYGVNIHRGVYNLSYRASEEYDETRKIVAKFINSKKNEVVFTKGTTEALNLVATSYGNLIINEGDEILTTELEHHSSLLPWQIVATNKKATLTYVDLDDEGRITVDEFKKVINEKTKVVVITYVSNVMGYVTPIKEIIDIAHSYNAIVVLDAAQAAPHMPIDVKELDVDFLAFSGHKMLGPTGLGVLYGKYKLLQEMPPMLYGGDMNDYVDLFESTTKDAPEKFEGGTQPIAEVIAFKEAIKYLDNLGMENIKAHDEELSKALIGGLSKIENVVVYNKTATTGIACFNVKGVHPHDIASALEEKNVAVRAGHHCAQLIHCWLGENGTLRASTYIYNNLEDIEKFLDAVKYAVEFFKGWS